MFKKMFNAKWWAECNLIIQKLLNLRRPKVLYIYSENKFNYYFQKVSSTPKNMLKSYLISCHAD